MRGSTPLRAELATKLGIFLVLAFASGCSGSSDGGRHADETGGASSSGGTMANGGATSSGGSSSATGGGAGSQNGTGGSAGSSAGTGGAAGSGVSGGNGGSPEHVVGECDSLGAVDEFEDITPADISLSGNGILDVAVDPIHAGTLYVGTDKQGIHKSTNCGADWVKINTGENGATLDSGMAWLTMIDPEHPDILYSSPLYGSDNSLYKSTNGGVDWKSLFPDGSEIANKVQYKFFQWAALDPTNSAHLFVTFHANCKDPESSDPNAPFDSMCLAESTDSGESWRLFKTNPAGTGWIEGAGPLMFGPTNWGLGTWLDGVYVTTDSGATWDKAGPGNSGLPFLSTDGHYYTGSYYGIQRVSADGQSWESVPSSPNVFSVVGDGTRLFASARDSGDGQQPYYTSPMDGSDWKPFSSPNMAHGAVHLQYESDHHVLYSANTSSGLWRMVTQ